MILQEAPDMYILSCFSDPREIEEQDCFLETLGAEFYATEIKCKRFIVEDNKPMFIQKAPEARSKNRLAAADRLMGLENRIK